jgi:hypothetical protein
VCDVGRGNLAISKLLALKKIGPCLRSTYWVVAGGCRNWSRRFLLDSRFGPDLVQIWFRFGPDLVQIWSRSGPGRHWIGGKRGEIIVGDQHVLMQTENLSCNFAKQRRFSFTQQEIGSFLFCFSSLDSAIGLWEKVLDFLAPNTSSCKR